MTFSCLFCVFQLFAEYAHFLIESRKFRHQPSFYSRRRDTSAAASWHGKQIAPAATVREHGGRIPVQPESIREMGLVRDPPLDVTSSLWLAPLGAQCQHYTFCNAGQKIFL
jgi:hypothetical protein